VPEEIVLFIAVIKARVPLLANLPGSQVSGAQSLENAVTAPSQVEMSNLGRVVDLLVSIR
jgi:hypothetical protein